MVEISAPAARITAAQRNLRADELSLLIVPGARVHMIGIGGVSMSPLAEELLRRGLRVSGSDIRESEAISKLKSLGIKINIGHEAGSVHGADFVVRTAAARDGNPEVDETVRLGIPLFERAEAWGVIMRDYENAICVAGSHGKTTTTSMIAQILIDAHRDPTVMIGGTLASLGSGYYVGKGSDIVLESCEYYDSFLRFFPTTAVILNVDNDHLDYFGTFSEVKNSFRVFAELPANPGVPGTSNKMGTVIYSADDTGTLEALYGIREQIPRALTFGLNSAADVSASNIKGTATGVDFNIIYKGKQFCSVSLQVRGDHNIKNALAAAAVAVNLGIGAQSVSEALSSFEGAERRFEFKGRFNGADIYDDYAHHPTELRALLDMALSLEEYNRVIIAFQPHTYSRTAAHLDEFAEQLKRSGVCYLAEIYAAREVNTYGIESENLAALVPGAKLCHTFEDLEASLRKEARPGDLIITVGAGELYQVAEAIAGSRENS